MFIAATGTHEHAELSVHLASAKGLRAVLRLKLKSSGILFEIMDIVIYSGVGVELGVSCCHSNLSLMYALEYFETYFPTAHSHSGRQLLKYAGVEHHVLVTCGESIFLY